ncbi:cation:proton antiporter [Halovivax sp.]|uniref:cation:proton antiporter n=1 Tax=Halovivax sp. TaxID=1935978 RepID=UPI0025BE0EAA|nr:cation:proton antiporter [Halovivax sp.]
MAEAVVLALAVIFVGAGLAGLLANHFDLPPVPFYIAAGFLVAPLLDEGDVLQLALWGIAFLVFVFGIRVEFGGLRSVLRDGEVAAMTQLLVVAPIAFGAGYGFAVAFDLAEPLQNGLFFAAAATLSSTLVGSGLLDRDLRATLVHGRLASSIHLFDDLVAVGVLLVISAEVLTADAVTSKLGYGVLFILAALAIHRHGFGTLIRAADGSDELVLMGSISILIGFLAAAEYVGISIVVGAFAAGLAIHDEGARTLEVRNGIESIRDFFAAIFFVTVGALVTIPTLEVGLFAAVLVVLVLLVNPLVMVLAFSYEGYDARTAFLSATSLNQVSELAIVIAIQAALFDHLTIATATFEAIILAAAVTMVAASLVRRREELFFEALAGRLIRGHQTRKIDERSDVEDDRADHVIIVGYGRQGRWLADACEEADRRYVVIDNDPIVWGEIRRECDEYVLGDAMASYTWEIAGVDSAALVISTVDHRPLSASLLEREPDADVVVRADTSAEASELLGLGATYVMVPNVLAGDQLVRNVERAMADDASRARLGEEHRELFESLERHGFVRQFER